MLAGFLGLTILPMASAQSSAEAPDDEARQDTVIITGSRIVRQDYTADSPIVSVDGEAVVANADITLDTYLNTLPQVNPAGSSTSNNPGNSGQAAIDLRGLGNNRNIVLIDGRRAMPSASDLTVDLNTIPAALVERIDIITGGAGAVYGADAVAGAVNVVLKDDFEGLDLRVGYQNSTEFWDSEEYTITGVLGGNFDDGRGNAVIAIETSVREGMVKSQRAFAEQATSTTSFFPEGSLTWGSANAPTEAAIDAVFASYGIDEDAVSVGNRFGFNLDGTLFSAGFFNSDSNVENFRYDVDGNVNLNLYPDAYSYNFDFVNLLTLPLERDSFMGKANYELDNGVNLFGGFAWTEYSAATALAPTPIPTVRIKAPGENTSTQAQSSLVESGQTVAFQLIVPTTNPFIPEDLQSILASRTGDNPALVGSGATEPFLMRQRTLSAGLRQSNFENTVIQYHFGADGPIGNSGWNWHAYLSEGRVETDRNQQGNIDSDRLQILLEAEDGGASICEGGFNPFGRNPLSSACVDYLSVSSAATTEFSRTVGQAYIDGVVAELPAGDLSAVLGVEYREFDFTFDPGSGGGPISGFNAQNPNDGSNSFADVFGEVLIPIVRDASWAQDLYLTLGYRYSDSDFESGITGDSGGSKDGSYKAELSWQPVDYARVRASIQRAVRAPNFSELFDGGGSAPQYFDPCSVTGAARNGADSTAFAALCEATGVTDTSSYVQTPGTQASIDTAGNTDLVPEEADTFTLGVTWTSPFGGKWSERLRGSVDYWKIDIGNPILSPGVNQVIADCYNYYGNNPNYDVNTDNCQAIVRGGGDIFFLSDPNDPAGDYPGVNGGSIEASGIDFQVDYGFDLEWLGLPESAGSIETRLLATYTNEWKQQELSTLPSLDFAGTVSFFGEGLGTSFPEYKANLITRWNVDNWSFDARTRFISGMENRAAVIFPDESFEGTDDVLYWDFAANWDVTENVAVRLGLNNAFDQEPQLYAPNVQSGTDPSLFDVVGRRVFGQLIAKF